jgi:preprotein translocase subunit SecF
MINILSKQSKLVSGKLSQEILNISTDIQDNMVKYNILFAKISDNIINSLLINFGKTEIRRMDFVDSHISSQLKTDSIMAVIYTIIAVFVYISIRFNLFFAPGVIVCLIQDVFGAFLIFTLFRYEFDLPSIAALLTIVGVSINNTIVVYDRIR